MNYKQYADSKLFADIESWDEVDWYTMMMLELLLPETWTKA